MGDVEKEGEGGSRVLSVGTACAETSAGSVPNQHLLAGPGDPFLVRSVCTQKRRLSLVIPAENINAPASAWGRGHAPRKSPRVTSSCLPHAPRPGAVTETPRVLTEEMMPVMGS